MSSCFPPFTCLTFPKSREKYRILTAPCPPVTLVTAYAISSHRPGRDSKNAFLSKGRDLPSLPLSILPSDPSLCLYFLIVKTLQSLRLTCDRTQKHTTSAGKRNQMPPHLSLKSQVSFCQRGRFKGVPECCFILNCCFSKSLRKT